MQVLYIHDRNIIGNAKKLLADQSIPELKIEGYSEL